MWQQNFPKLASSPHKVTSPKTAAYNCIAWAAADTSRWWWPDPFFQYYWPPLAKREETLAVFITVFKSLGYLEMNIDPTSPGEKVALYALGGSPTHAARQLPSGRWTSKLGPEEDIEHELTAIEGPTYGSVAIVLGRKKANS
jgi:hypothetical protein